MPKRTARQRRRSRRPKATWESLASEGEPASGRQDVCKRTTNPKMIPETRKNACWFMTGSSDRFFGSPPDLHNYPSQRNRSEMATFNRGSALAYHHQWSSKSRFSQTARNLSRILGLKDLSSASASKPSSINSEGMVDKTLMTAPR